MRKLPTEDLDRVRENEVQNGPFHFLFLPCLLVCILLLVAAHTSNVQA